MTDAQRERLVMLIEECAEVQKECTKILRHGYHNYHPDEGPTVTNRSNLEREITDLLAILLSMDVKGDISVLTDEYEISVEQLEEIWKRKMKWTTYQ